MHYLSLYRLHLKSLEYPVTMLCQSDILIKELIFTLSYCDLYCDGFLIKLLLTLLLGMHLTVFWYSVVQEAEILNSFCCHWWTVGFSWSFSAPPVSQPVLTPAQVCKEMCESYFQDSKLSLFAGVVFLKNPTISEIPVHEVKTICRKWV